MRKTTLALAFTLALLGGGVAAAAPTTVGVEWEMPHLLIDLTAAVADPEAAQPTYERATATEIGSRLFCSTERSKVDPTYPQVSVTFDLKANLGGKHVRQLEVVTGPIVHRSKDWKAILGFLARTFDALDRHCAVAPRVGVGTGQYCAIAIDDLVARIDGATTRCHAAPADDLAAEAAAEVTVLLLDSVPDRLATYKDVLRAAVNRAHTQVSLAIDLETYGDPHRDLTALYDQADESRPSLARQAYQYFHAQKLPALEALSAEQRGFLALYFVGLHAYNAYFVDRLREAKGGDYATWLGQYQITDPRDWKLKHNLTVLPKDSLDGIYARLSAADAGFTPARFSGGTGANVDFFCDPAFLAGVELDDDELGARQLGELAARCREIYQAFWEAPITGSPGRDPLRLATLANVIPSQRIDGKLRVVFELRRANPIVEGHRPMLWPDGSVTLYEEDVDLPAGLDRLR